MDILGELFYSPLFLYFDLFSVYNSKCQSFFPLYLNREVPDMKYNERIRKLRQENSMTQQEIADLLHVGQRTYCDYESGKTRIPIESIMILASHYNVSVDYITGASKERCQYPKE